MLAPDGGRIEVGDLILGDLKTGKLDFAMSNFCVQTFLYTSGKLYDVITDRRLATPPIRQDWSLLIHLPVGKAKCEVLWCNLEIGRRGAQLARDVKEWRKLWKNGTYDCPVVGVPVDPVVELSSQLGAEVVGEVSLATMSRVLPVPDRGDRITRPRPQVAADEVARGPAFPEERDHFG